MESVASKLQSKRRSLILALSVLAICACTWIILNVFRRDTMRSVADKTFTAILDGDGGTFVALMSDPERELYGMDAEQWSRLLREYVRPELRKWHVLGNPVYEYDRPSDNLFRKQFLARADGKTIDLSMCAVRTGGEPKHYLTVGTLIAALANSKFPAGDAVPTQRRKSLAFRDFLRSESRTLESYGLYGVANISGNRVETWGKILQETERRLSVLEQRSR